MCGPPRSSGWTRAESQSQASARSDNTQHTFNKDLQLIEDSGFASVVQSNNDDLVLCETSRQGRQWQQV